MATLGVESMDFHDTNESLKCTILLGDVLQYSFAYPRIYLRPTDATRAESLSKRFQDYGYIAVDVDLSQLTIPSIQIVCDELVLIGNETYTGNVKNLEIHCRRLSFVEGLASSNAADNRKITFDLSGVNSGALTAEPQKDAKNVDDDALKAMCSISYRNGEFDMFGGWITNLFIWGGSSSQARAGADADPIAKPGKRGISGGKFTLVADSIDPKMLELGAPTIFVRSNGSQGGPAQAGGNGANGGKGLDLVFPSETNICFGPNDDKNLKYLVDVFEGGKGGQGGHGGPGGRGGNGGALAIICSEDLDIEKKLASTELQCGQDGSDGNDGSAGNKGDDSGSGVYRVSGWKTIASLLDDNDPYKEKCLDFDPYGKGHTSSGNTPNPTSINTAQRWNLIAEQDRQPAAVAGTTSYQPKQIESVRSRLSADTSFLELLIRRLDFEHFVYFTSQRYDSLSGNATLDWVASGQAAFQDRFGWLTSILEPLQARIQAKSSEVGPHEISIAYQFMLLSHKAVASPMVDIFRHSINFVSWVPNRDSYNGIMADYKTVENAYVGFNNILQSHQKDRVVATKQINEANKAIRSSFEEVKKSQLEISDTEAEYGRADRVLNFHLTQLKANIEAFKEVLAGHIECSGEQVCDALSNVLMFGNGKSRASVAGSVLSVGTSMYKSIDEAANTIGGVRKDLLYGKMNYMSKTQDELQKEISSSLKDIAKNPTAVGELRQQIVANQQDFEELAKGILKDIKAGDELRQRFRNVLKALEQKSKAIANYNQAFATVAAQQLVIVKQETAIEQLKSSTATELADEDTQVLGQFSTRVFQDMARFAFWAIYTRARAYNCISFKPSRVFEYMSNLHSFSSLTSTRLDQLNSMLNKDLIVLASEWSRNPRSKTIVGLSLDDTTDPFLLQDIRDKKLDAAPNGATRNGSLELDIDHDFFFAHANNFKDTDAYDLRMYAMGVYFYDAVLTTEASGGQPITKTPGGKPPTTATEERILLHMQSHGISRYRYPNPDKSEKAPEWIPQNFEMTTSTVSFDYIHNKTKNTYRPNSTLFPSEQLSMEIITGEGSQYDPIPLQSPLGVWTIIPVKNVDTSNVHKVVVEFEISYRVR